MARGESLPDADHIVRSCSSRGVQKKRVLPAAFALRDGEAGASCGWVECPAVPSAERTPEKAVERLPAGYCKRPSALLNVGEVKATCKTRELCLDVIDTSHPGNSCHVEIRGYSNTIHERYFELKLSMLANNREIISVHRQPPETE